MYKQKNDRLRENKTVSLSEVVDAYIREHVPENARQLSALWRAWERTASDRVREHTDSVVYGKNNTPPVVLVYVDDSSWAAELSMQREFYRIRLEEELGRPVSEVKFLVSRKTFLRKQQEG